MSRDRWSYLFYGIYIGVDNVEAIMTQVPAKKTKVNVYGRHSGELEGQEDFIEEEEHQVLTVDGKDYRYDNDQDWDDVMSGLSIMGGGLTCDVHMVDGNVIGFVVGGHIQEHSSSKEAMRVFKAIDDKKMLAKAFKKATKETQQPRLMLLDCDGG